MPTRLERFCKEYGCNNRTASRSGYCESHEQDNTKAARRREYVAQRPVWYKWYDLALWRHRLQPMVLRRDPVCVVCNRYASTEADHIVPHRGDWKLFVELSNLQGLCHNCHSEKTAKENNFGEQVCVPADKP